VSHRLDEILDLCARATAFRDGRPVLHAVRERLTRQQLVEAIVGGATPAAASTLDRAVDSRDILLEIERLTRGKAVREVSLQLRCGEILGLAGLVGSGRSEVVRMIFGADRPDRGRMRLAGAEFAPNSPQLCSVAAR
jgi:ribose transport system ATP-binding protein